MSTRSLTQARRDPYAHVKGPLEGQTGTNVRTVARSDAYKVVKNREEVFYRMGAATVCQMLMDCDDFDEESEAATGHLTGGSYANGPKIVEAVEKTGSTAQKLQESSRTLKAEQPFLIVDVRELPDDFDKLHIMEAVHCPRAAYLTQDRAPLQLHLAKRMSGCTIIVYDSGNGTSRDAVDVADKLGKTCPEEVRIAVLQGGLAAVLAHEPLALDGTTAADVAAEAAAKAAVPPSAAEMRAMQRQAAVVAAGLLRPRGNGSGSVRGSDASSVAPSAPGSPGSPGKGSVMGRSMMASSMRSTASTKAPGGAASSIYKVDAGAKPPTFGTAARFSMPRINE